MALEAICGDWTALDGTQAAKATHCDRSKMRLQLQIAARQGRARRQPTAWRSGGTSRRQPEPVQGEASLVRGRRLIEDGAVKA